MYPSENAATEMLARIGYPRERVPLFTTAQAFWGEVLADLERPGSGMRAPFRQLRGAAQTHKAAVREFDEILPPPDAGLPRAIEVGKPQVAGCHAIVWTETDGARQAVHRWLEAANLGPRQVWANHEMTSFEVNQTDAGALAGHIRARFPQLLFKMLPPDAPDDLIGTIMVTGADGQQLPLPWVPNQLTVSELAEGAARFHPASASASTAAASRRNGRPTAVHHGAGFTRRVQLDTTLVQDDFRNGDEVAISSLRFHPIRVVFVGANPKPGDAGAGPGPEGYVPLAEARLSEERRKIRQQADSGHITLVGEFTNVQRTDVREIVRRRPDIIHLACRGEKRALLWEDGDGNMDPVPVDWLVRSIAMRSARRLSAIVLTACAGEAVAPILSDAARTVIAHCGLLADNLAISFTKSLYEELSQIPVLETAAKLAADDGYGGGLSSSLIIVQSSARGDS